MWLQHTLIKVIKRDAFMSCDFNIERIQVMQRNSFPLTTTIQCLVVTSIPLCLALRIKHGPTLVVDLGLISVPVRPSSIVYLNQKAVVGIRRKVAKTLSLDESYFVLWTKPVKKGRKGRKRKWLVHLDFYQLTWTIDRTGPLAPYIRAGKLIPRLIDPWLDMDLVFVRGLTSDNLLTMLDNDNDHDDEEMDE